MSICDHYALTHAAGKLVRILPCHLFGVGYLHGVQHFYRLLRRFLFAHVLVNDKGLAELFGHGEHRIEAGHRLLEDDGNFVSADMIHLLQGFFRQVFPFEKYLAAVDIAVGVQKLQYAHCRNGFAAAAFAHYAQRPARLDGIADVVYRLDDAFARLEIGVKVFNFQ